MDEVQLVLQRGRKEEAMIMSLSRRDRKYKALIGACSKKTKDKGEKTTLLFLDSLHCSLTSKTL